MELKKEKPNKIEFQDLEIQEDKEGLFEYSLELLKVDFEQRSLQITNLTMDRSKFLRLSLLVWGGPLIFVAALVNNDSIDELLNNQIILAGIGISVFICTIINFLIFILIQSNWNTVKLSASGINFIRSIYFKILNSNKIVDLENDQILSKVVNLNGGVPKFKPVNSKSNTLVLYTYSFVNIIFCLTGLIIMWFTNLVALKIAFTIIFIVISILHFFTIRYTNEFRGLNS